MKKTLLTAFVAALALKVSAQTSYTQVALTGYNADLIANGSGSAMTSTNNDTDANGNVFAAQNFVNPSNQTPAANTALPNTGLITSAVTTTPGLTFQLAPYTGNNGLKVLGNASGTVTFATPLSTTELYVLLTPINYSGSMPVTFTVNFTDGTNQVFSGTTITYNWYGGTGAAWSGTTRVSRTTNILDVQTLGPRMFQQKLAISAANASKSIQSILVANGSAASTNNALIVMAVTALTPASTLPTDAGITAVSSVNSGCALTNAETITVTVKNYGTNPQSNVPVSYKINNGTPVVETVAGPIPANSSVTYSFTQKANLSTVGTYSVEARTNLTGDLLATNDAITKTIVLAAPAAVPTVTSGGSTTFCAGGSTTLTAASTTTGATYQWFKDGVAINGATNATYSANAAGSYTATALAGGCASAASAPVALTVTPIPAAPAVNGGGNVAICPGATLTLTASSTATGATYTWFKNGNLIAGANANTYVVNAAGAYTAAATVNGCTSPSSVASNITIKSASTAPTITRSGAILTSSAMSSNQWYKDAVLIPGATNKTYTVTANGVYTCIVNSNGCPSVASNAITITNLGIADEMASLAVKVFPNPSTGLFSIELPQSKAELTVTDITGKTVKQLSVKEQNVQLNLTDASKGIYFLKIVAEGKVAVRKLIVE